MATLSPRSLLKEEFCYWEITSELSCPHFGHGGDNPYSAGPVLAFMGKINEKEGRWSSPGPTVVSWRANARTEIWSSQVLRPCQGKRPCELICSWLWSQSLSQLGGTCIWYMEPLFCTCILRVKFAAGKGLCKQMNLALYSVIADLESLLDHPEKPRWGHSSSILPMGAWNLVCRESTWQENLSSSLKWEEMNSQPPNGPTPV